MVVKVIREWAVKDDGGVDEGKLVLGRYEESEGGVLRLEMLSSSKGNGVFENRFTNDFITAFGEALDLAVEEKNKAGSGALVITSSGKIWSNGLHIESIMKDKHTYVQRYLSLLHQSMTLPMPVVAACQGHTFAGGMLFALTCEGRVASSDKGFWCMPEVDLGFPLTESMNAIIKDKVRDPSFQTRMMLEGIRIKADELLKEGIVNTTTPGSQVEKEAIKIAERMAKKSGSSAYGELKSRLFERSVNALAAEVGKAKL